MSTCHNSDKVQTLSGSQRKTAFALRFNCETICALGLDSVGFLTLTVGDYVCAFHGKQLPDPDRKKPSCPCCGSSLRFQQVTDASEASRRVDSLNRRVLKGLFIRAAIVSERHATGAIHFHLLGALRGLPDIRSGIDFRAIKLRRYTSASPALRGLWRSLRATLPKYGFGRSELLPIRKSGKCVAAYVAKYIEKNICQRVADDKRKKLVRYLGFEKQQLKPNDFEWNTPAAKAWRERSRAALALVGIPLPDRKPTPSPTVTAACEVYADRIRPKSLDGSMASNVIGSRWAFMVTTLLEKLGMNKGQTITQNFLQQDLLSRELQRLAGRTWCIAIDRQPLTIELLGNMFSRKEWTEMWKGLPPVSSLPPKYHVLH